MMSFECYHFREDVVGCEVLRFCKMSYNIDSNFSEEHSHMQFVSMLKNVSIFKQLFKGQS
jgi:hypothetical protein